MLSYDMAPRLIQDTEKTVHNLHPISSQTMELGVEKDAENSQNRIPTALKIKDSDPGMMDFSGPTFDFGLGD